MKNNNDLEVFASKLAYALAHKNVKQEIKYALEDIYIKALEEVDDASVRIKPEIVKVIYPALIKSFNGDYGLGLHHAMTAVYSSIAHQTQDFDDSQFDEHFAQAGVEQNRIDDGVSIDLIEGESLALAISNLLNNPNLPVEIYNGIQDGINEIEHRGQWLAQYAVTPAYINEVLKYGTVEGSENVLDLSEHGENFNITAECVEAIISNGNFDDATKQSLRSCVGKTEVQ